MAVIKKSGHEGDQYKRPFCTADENVTSLATMEFSMEAFQNTENKFTMWTVTKLVGSCPESKSVYHRDNCISVLIEALFIIAKL